MTTKNDSKTGESQIMRMASRVGFQAIIPDRRDVIICSTQKEAQEIVDAYNEKASSHNYRVMHPQTDAQKLAGQKKLQIAIEARDGVRQLAAAASTFESELHKMADRLDAIAKQIGYAELLKMS